MPETSSVILKQQDEPKLAAAYDKLTCVPASSPMPESKHETFHKMASACLNFLPLAIKDISWVSLSFVPNIT